jgi:hypothetical protein
LNGRSLGLYVLVEGFNKQFLKRHFSKADNNLYDGGFLKDIDKELAVNNGDNPKDQSDRVVLLEASREKDLDKRAERLRQVLDLERFITFIALDVMLWNWDGYAQNRNNWRLYRDPANNKMVFIPHGLDQMFWKPEGSILPSIQGLVAKAVLSIPEFRTRYFERMKELRATVLLPESITNRAHAITAKLKDALNKEDKEVAREQEKALAKLCDAIMKRAASIDQQLAEPIRPVEFNQSGEVLLAKWQSKADFGRPSMERDAVANNAPQILRIGTSAGSSIGTWRTKVWLDPGRYRLQGRVKVTDIVPDIGDTRGGAGLRLQRARPEDYILGTSDWKTVEHEFSVDDLISEVQILCEFRGASGQALFDSVKLTRFGPTQ